MQSVDSSVMPAMYTKAKNKVVAVHDMHTLKHMAM